MELINRVKDFIFSNLVLIVSILVLFIINDVVIISVCGADSVSISNSELTYDKQELPKKEINKSLINVDIKGYVKKPGVYEVSEGTNVLELINIAGGLKKNATTDNINLSKKLADQMVVFVSKKTKTNNKTISTEINTLKNEVVETSILNNAKIENYIGEPIYTQEVIDNADTVKLISLNNASKEELLTLTGIGESKAEAIINYRKGTPFNTIEDVMNVSGIGEALFAKIKDSITI